MDILIENILVFFISTVLCFLLIKVFINYFRYYYLGHKIPGPSLLQVVTCCVSGSLENTTKNLMQLFEIWIFKNQNSDFFKIWIGPKLAIIPKRPELLNKLLHEHLKKADFYDFLKGYANGGILLQNHIPTYKHHRNIVTSTSFKNSSLKSYTEIFYQEANILADKMEPLAKSFEDFDPVHLVAIAQIAIVSRTFSGFDSKFQQKHHNSHPCVDATAKIVEVFILRVFKPWLKIDWIYKLSGLKAQEIDANQTLNTFIENEIIANVKAKVILDNAKHATDISEFTELEPGNPGMSFIETVVRTQLDPNVTNLMTHYELNKEVHTVLGAGFDTTKTTTTFILKILAIHPNIQEEVYNEIVTVLGPNLDSTPSYAQMQELHLLDRVIKETLRMFPPLSFIARDLDQEFQHDGYTIPANSTIVILIYSLHRDPNYWSDPHRFDPNRFLPSEFSRNNTTAFVPFSMGPRMCPGYKYAMLSMKVVVSTLLRKYKILPGAGLKTLDDIKFEFGMTLRPLPGSDIRIQPRHG